MLYSYNYVIIIIIICIIAFLSHKSTDIVECIVKICWAYIQLRCNVVGYCLFRVGKECQCCSLYMYDITLVHSIPCILPQFTASGLCIF